MQFKPASSKINKRHRWLYISRLKRDRTIITQIIKAHLQIPLS